MANELKVIERALPVNLHGGALEVEGEFVASQLMSPTGTTSYSAAFNSLTKVVNLYSSAACWYKFGTSNPTVVSAAATASYLPANTLVREKVPPGATQITVIT